MDNIGKIGLFKIIGESGIAAGTRRIEAKTGYGAYLFQKKEEENLQNIAKIMKTSATDIVEKVEKLVDSFKEKEKELGEIKQKIAALESQSILMNMEDIHGVKVVLIKFSDKRAEDLRTMIDTVKSKEEKVIVILASTLDPEKLIYAVGVSKSIIKRIKAGDIVKKLAEMTGGKGGGRPDFAQAGGKEIHKLDIAMQKVKEWIKETLA